MSSQDQIVLQRLLCSKQEENNLYINPDLKIVYLRLWDHILYALFNEIEKAESIVKWGILVHVEFCPDYRNKFLNDCISLKEFAQKVENAKD